MAVEDIENDCRKREMTAGDRGTCQKNGGRRERDGLG